MDFNFNFLRSNLFIGKAFCSELVETGCDLLQKEAQLSPGAPGRVNNFWYSYFIFDKYV